MSVPKEKYLEILAFTSYAYLSGKITSYSGIIGGKRAFGEYLENFIYGKVAEVAFQEFLKTKTGLEVLIDLDLADFVLGMYLPDIIAVKKNGAYEVMKFWIEVKEVRRDQRWLLIPASSVRERPYDAYVAVWVGLPDEHVLWLISQIPDVSAKMTDELKDRIAEIGSKVERIPCRIIGFAMWSDVKQVLLAHKGNAEAREALDKKYCSGGWFYFTGKEALFDPDDRAWTGSRVGENVGFALKRLARATDWKTFREHIDRNERLVLDKLEVKTKKGIPELCRNLAERDIRELYLKCLNKQLDSMKARYKTIVRKTSWFAQPLT